MLTDLNFGLTVLTLRIPGQSSKQGELTIVDQKELTSTSNALNDWHDLFLMHEGHPERACGEALRAVWQRFKQVVTCFYPNVQLRCC